MKAALLRLFSLSLWLAMAGCGDAIVGAECRAGTTLCDGACVDTRADFRHCGGCGNHCGIFVCDEGMCTGDVRPDASLPDGGLPTLDGALLPPQDGGDGDGGPLLDGGGGFQLDAGLGGCSIGQQECGGSCIEPRSDPAHCGACDNACSSGAVCSGGSCSAACQAPLSLCNGRCFDFDTNPNHCGGCNNVCSSGICESGVCADRIAGHAVVIGHDFTSSNRVMQRLAGNAVFLGRGAPVRVLAYRGEANAASVTGVESAINQVKSEIGREFTQTDAIESIVPLQLATADVFLVHAQARARKSTLLKLGQQWGTALAQFVATGGVIVLFEGPSTQNDGTFRVLEPALIFGAVARETITNQQLHVVAPGIGVAVRVPGRYMSASSTVRFSGVSTTGTAIVVDGDDRPIIVHRILTL